MSTLRLILQRPGRKHVLAAHSNTVVDGEDFAWLWDVDLEQLVVNAPLGLDEAAQKNSVTTVAIAFNELLPMIPMFERFGNNPALEGVRVKAWPPDSDPILLNAPYGDNFTIMLLLTGQLTPV